MPQIPVIHGVSQIAEQYDALLCDVWGVLHNGLSAFEPAKDALQRYREETGKPVVLLTNAPRPNHAIEEHLASMGITRDSFDAIVTSGDVVRADLEKQPEPKIYHIGPERNRSLFRGLSYEICDEETGEVIVCTALNNRNAEEPEDYRPLFERLLARDLTFVCANPDIVSHEGEKLVWCAGSLARLYAQMGGKTLIMGKPFAPIYDAALAKINELAGKPVAKDRVLAIGDGMPTDIKGANAMDIPVLFISNGIHALEYGSVDNPDIGKVEERFKQEGMNAAALLPSLRW
ncbi:TIGR01459 family HAD-type hydrolase [Rhodobacteraceae bacterium RKSG542]|uniref:TIGR01459 family HAD-type hydrolase n=1 Tax=Pseudovibrio flavus TaxID=2529854 RepID=UPI0012BC094A|nr:TIGR01459 family HAD-type hydrolase [Pseudovibrio flavus]MTI18616.1 TIGR01459 family HAD-type hydrolase [Pseudovibrio flavus]